MPNGVTAASAERVIGSAWRCDGLSQNQKERIRWEGRCQRPHGRLPVDASANLFPIRDLGGSGPPGSFAERFDHILPLPLWSLARLFLFKMQPTQKPLGGETTRDLTVGPLPRNLWVGLDNC